MHTFYVTYHLCYITKQCSIYNMLYTMSMRRLYNNKTCYIYNLQLIYTFEYNTLHKKIKTCYVAKVVCNLYKVLYILLHDMVYSCLENQCDTSAKLKRYV